MRRRKTLLTISFLACTAALARPPGPPPVEERLKRLEERLQLTPEQKPKVEAILKEQREKIQAVREETRSRLKSVLTPEQAEKFEDLHREKRERWRRRLHQRLPRAEP
ncbi:hypothetical protein JCM13664_08760 [Methylothermus subterraneus]